jgi:exosome complex component RRP4
MSEETEEVKRWLVVPGDLITDKKVKLGPNVFVEGGKVYSKVVGLAEIRNNTARVIPLEGRYVPREGDPVIGIVVDVKIPGYDIDLNSPYLGFLPNEELSEEASYGDVVMATVKKVDEVRNALLEKGNILRGGELITINPKKIPRVIGKKKSMLNLLQNLTGVIQTVYFYA